MITFMKKLILGFCVLFLAGCSSLSVDTADSTTGKFVTQYSVLKLIEQSDDIGVDEVVAVVDRMRDRLNSDTEISFQDLKNKLLAEIDFASMEPSDKLLAMTITDRIVADVQVGVDTDFVTDEQRFLISTFLDWVEEATLLAGE